MPASTNRGLGVRQLTSPKRDNPICVNWSSLFSLSAQLFCEFFVAWKLTKEQKAALKRKPQCSIQFPTEDNVADPYAKLIAPESLEGDKFKQSFKRMNSKSKETNNK